MRTVNGCILLLAAISITFAAVSGAYHLDMQQLLALILRQENVPVQEQICLLYTSPSPRDNERSRMPSYA